MSVQERKWSSYLVQGLVALAFGIILWAWPAVTLGAFIVLFAVWAIVGGLIGAIVSLANRDEPGWQWRLLGGLITLAIGVVVLVWPEASVKTVLFLVAIYAIIMGLAEIVVGLTAGFNTGAKVLLVIVGLIAVFFGIFLLVDMKETIKAALWIVALFATLEGLFYIVASFFVRSEQKKGGGEPLTPAAA
jgi:uncharacterized membrane protein HdeD (DUF308 family)